MSELLIQSKRKQRIVNTLRLLHNWRIQDFEKDCGIPKTEINAIIDGRRAIPDHHLDNMEKNLERIMNSIPESSTIDVSVMLNSENSKPKNMSAVVQFDYYKHGNLLRRDLWEIRFEGTDLSNDYSKTILEIIRNWDHRMIDYLNASPYLPEGSKIISENYVKQGPSPKFASIFKTVPQCSCMSSGYGHDFAREVFYAFKESWENGHIHFA